MKRSKLLVLFLVLTMLVLLACSFSPSVINLSRQTSPSNSTVLATSTAVSVQPTALPSPSSIPAIPTLVGSTQGLAPTSTPSKVQPAANQAPQPSLAASGDITTFQNTLEALYQKVNPSVVSIQVVEQPTAGSSGGSGSNQFGGNTGPSLALGSGFVWDTQGHIVTNNHVVSGSSRITVTFADGTTMDATLVGADPNADLAVIKVNAPASELHPVEVADSTQVKVGQIAIAIGNPFGLANTMTEGIISALARSLPVGLDNQTAPTGPTYSIPDIIQTDAPINPGNSGGVLVDINGQLIGVTAAIESASQSNSGIGFVIPSEIVNKVVPPIIQTGKFNHPWLGITGTSVTPDIAKAMNLDQNQKGALIIDVTSGGPAAKAGLLAGTNQTTINGNDVVLGGDIITAVNDHAINSMDDLIAYVFIHTNANDNVTLTILRQGKVMKVPLTVGIFPAQ